MAVGNYDPIMEHNEPASPHQHQFFGNKGWLTNLDDPNAANYDDMAGQPTTCRVGSDTAGYWTPTLRYKVGTPKAGELIPVQQFTAYYRPFTGSGTQTGPGIAYPADTRLVSFAGHYNWNCGQYSGARSAPGSSIPDCTGLSGKPGNTLTAHIDFPSCWDGVAPEHASDAVGDTSDNVHYTYPVKKSCPAAFPVQTVQLRVTLQFAYVGPGNDVELSADGTLGVDDGQALHADFFNAWDQPAFEDFVRNCVNAGGTYTNQQCQP